MTRLKPLTAIGFLLSLSTPAFAGPVTWEFVGEVTRVLDEDDLFESRVSVGSPFHGTLTFESTTPDSQPHPAGGVYNDSVIELFAEAGALTIAGPKTSSSSAPNRIRVDDSPAQPFASDLYWMSIPVTVLGYESFRLELVAVDNTATVFDDDSLPLDPPAFPVEEIRFFLVDSSETFLVAVDGYLTSLRFVPEPSALLLLGLGAATCLQRRHRRKACTRRVAQRGFVFFIVVGIALRAQGADCNSNGLDDVQELAQCKIDIVAVFDTSSSMTGTTMDRVCSVLNNAKTTLVQAPQFINCIFRNNGEAGTSDTKGGGAIFVHAGTPTFVNCLFHNNKAGEGGVLLIAQGTPTFINCTMVNNQATIGSGGALYDHEGQATLRNCILWNNTATTGGNQLASGSSGLTTVTHCDVQGGWFGSININADPIFLDPGANDYRLSPFVSNLSPCIDVGSATFLPMDVGDVDFDNYIAETIPLDLGLSVRTRFGLVDMGAYEVNDILDD